MGPLMDGKSPLCRRKGRDPEAWSKYVKGASALFAESLPKGMLAEEGLGVLFFSPSKVTRARELQIAKEAAKDEEALEKLLQAQDRADQKVQKELEAQQKREDRAITVKARKAKEALKKAQRQQQKEARKAQRQLETESKTSSSRPRKRQKTQKEPQEPDVVVIELEPQMAPDQPKSRSGRTIRKPAYYGEG
ncbi:hypothetical protein LTS10_013115 [Elasticomyces elasticus]|nr:hypothetical protein LTS10_013115 [Elasticomyces elasticus]